MTQMCVIDFYPDVLRSLLRLPEGTRITAVAQSVDLHGVLRVRVEGMGWDTQEGEAIRLARPILTTTDEQAVHVDWSCPPPTSEAKPSE